MTKSKFYQEFKKLVRENDIEITGQLLKWTSKGSTTKYWEKMVNKVKKRLAKKKINLNDLKKLTKDKFKFTSYQVREIVKEMYENKYYLQIVFDDGTNTLIPINIVSEEKIQTIENLFLNYFEQIKAKQTGSDQIEQYILKGIKFMQVYDPRKNQKKSKKKNKSGKYFKHWNNTDINLERYQISAIDGEISRENCLIHSLKMGGIDKTLINDVKLAFINGGYIPRNKLIDVSNIIKTNITIYFYLNDNKTIRKTKYGKHRVYDAEERLIKLGVPPPDESEDQREIRNRQLRSTYLTLSRRICHCKMH